MFISIINRHHNIQEPKLMWWISFTFIRLMNLPYFFGDTISFSWQIFSLRRGDLIGMSCLSVCLLVCRSVLRFLIFKKEVSRVKNATCLIRPSLYCFIHLFKRIQRGTSKQQVVQYEQAYILWFASSRGYHKIVKSQVL